MSLKYYVLDSNIEPDIAVICLGPIPASISLSLGWVAQMPFGCSWLLALTARVGRLIERCSTGLITSGRVAFFTVGNVVDLCEI